MLWWIWLIPAIPFASAAILALVGSRFPARATAILGSGSIGASTAVAGIATWSFLSNPPAGHAFQETLWIWVSVGSFRPEIALRLDSLSLAMVLVVTFVAFFIHLYSTEFMRGDEGYSRFFAYMNLFVASMATLLLADNLLLLYLGWEGVGLCSYLLIGFWYRDAANGLAARKAFIVTRVGDTAMAIALFLLFTQLGTLRIQDSMAAASREWGTGSAYATAAALLLLGGAVGKSAQLPLQVWLPDAMAGPTPTSALIHAATMVTAGVYLIARMNVLFALAPAAQFAVAVVGAVTLCVAGCSALTQHDLKRALAYSTISQIGYMFLALGVGAWSAAIFHFMTHAFFKALLFLCAGVAIESLNGEHDIFHMGGLRTELPVTFWTFLAAGCSLAGLPLITAGYFSKDLIIWRTWLAPEAHHVLWAAAILGAFLTSVYTFRLVFLVFFGDVRTRVERRPGWAILTPLAVLGILSIGGGWMRAAFLDFIEWTLPLPAMRAGAAMSEPESTAIAAGVFAIGVYIAYVFFLRDRSLASRLARSRIGRAIHELWASDWAFDWMYRKAFVEPLEWFARVDRNDVVDRIYEGMAAAARSAHRSLSLSETGRLRWYAAWIAAGAALFVAVVLIR